MAKVFGILAIMFVAILLFMPFKTPVNELPYDQQMRIEVWWPMWSMCGIDAPDPRSREAHCRAAFRRVATLHDDQDLGDLRWMAPYEDEFLDFVIRGEASDELKQVLGQ